MISPEHESAHSDGNGRAGFGDAVTFAFADRERGVCGSARLGLVPGFPTLASSLALLFVDGAPVAVDATGAVELTAAAWEDVEVGDVRATIERPLTAWHVAYDGDDGGFDLRFTALGPPVEVAGEALAASAADVHGYEQLCRVTGAIRHGERRLKVDCLGQRGHQWGAPDWERMSLTRTLSAWFDDGAGVALMAMRPDGEATHANEIVSAALLESEGATAVAEPLLSTTLDSEGRQRAASLELWEDDDEHAYPRRAAGEAVCGTTLELGRLRLDCAFFVWRMEGRQGIGRYDVLRRT